MTRNMTMMAASLAALGVGSIAGVKAADFTDYAQVISAQPIVERVNEPTQRCWDETVSTNEPRQRDHDLGGAIVGGLVGGVLGHQVGSGRGRDVATAGGAVAGALVGDNIDNRNNGSYEPSQRTVQRCRTVDGFRDEVRGYDVTYQYNGRNVRVRLPHDPGPRVRVAVSVIQ